MQQSEIEVGKTYRLGGQTRYPKKVIAFEPRADVTGGPIAMRSVRPDGTMGQVEYACAEWFAEKAIEKLD